MPARPSSVLLSVSKNCAGRTSNGARPRSIQRSSTARTSATTGGSD